MLYEILDEQLTPANKEYVSWGTDTCEALISAMERAWVDGHCKVATNYYAQHYSVTVIADITYALSQLGFIKSVVRSKWAEIEVLPEKIAQYRTSTELNNFRMAKRVEAHSLRLDRTEPEADIVKCGTEYRKTGLIRKGFARVSKNEFALDTDMLVKYYTPIVLNVIKSMTEARKAKKLGDRYLSDAANYDQVAQQVIDLYIANPDAHYNLESVASDPRGRAVFKAMKRIFNPISSKDARACLRMPTITVSLDNKVQMNDIFYFIAELTSSKATSESGKYFAGLMAYNRRTLPEADLNTTHGRKELHELIWLERIYSALEELYASESGSIDWNIPLEVDAGMSLAQFNAALLNEERLLLKTNVIGTELTDPWNIPGVRRLAGKLVGTPQFYGSSQAPAKLIMGGGLDIIPEEMPLIKAEFKNGAFSIITQFKDALINNYNNHVPEMQVKLWNDTFVVPVNKFKAAGSEKIFTTAYDTESGKRRTAITHKPILIPDYERFKYYMKTLLIHGLDGQVMNSIAIKVDEWMITIHDAVIAAPGVCRQVREQYAIELKSINRERDSILSNYRESIGATGYKADVDFMKLHKAVHQAEDIQFSPSAMK